MPALSAPVRPFAYMFAYTAGAHKAIAIRGHFSFFDVDSLYEFGAESFSDNRGKPAHSCLMWANDSNSEANGKEKSPYQYGENEGSIRMVYQLFCNNNF